MISADVKQALSNMKPKLDNYIFREWVDAAIACQDDKSLKSTLTPPSSASCPICGSWRRSWTT